VAYLLDTNIVSELAKARCDPNVRAWAASISPDDLYISSLVVGEIRKGIELFTRRNDHPQAARTAEWFNELKRRFASRIVPIETSVAIVWGRMAGQHNHPAPIDGLMAATAYLNDWTFVTRNTKDVAQTGVRTLDPFEPMATSS
jgi:predicted nucleic acid-binding protein